MLKLKGKALENFMKAQEKYQKNKPRKIIEKWSARPARRPLRVQSHKICYRQKHKCKELDASKACYIRFGKGEYKVSNSDFVNVNGEILVIDFDKKKRVLGIEIVKE